MPHKDPVARRAARRKWMRGYYIRERATHLARVKAVQNRLREAFQDFKSTLRGTQCGESHPACLEFHHRRGEEKGANVADLVNSGWPMKRILEEIKKCDVLCANCHRKEHWEEKKRLRAEASSSPP